MKQLTLDDVMDIAAYEKVRDRFREETIATKEPRRVPLGDLVTFVFENRDTLRFQVQEMVRAERLVEEGAIQAELDVYNTLMPSGSDLSATCFIEITDKERIMEILHRFIGLDQPGAVRLRLGGGRAIQAAFEQGRSEEDRISAVHYVRFPFTPDDVAWWCSGQGEAVLSVELPDYRHSAPIPRATREALAADFSQGG